MKRAAPALVLLLLTPPFPAQESPGAERAKLLVEFRQSFGVWREADTLLDRASEPQEQLKRLKDAEAKWSAAAAARSSYFRGILPFHQGRASAVGGTAAKNSDPVQVEAAGQNTLTDLSADLSALDRQIKTQDGNAPPASPATALRTQRDALAALANLYRTRQQSLLQVRQLNTSIEKSRARLTERYESVAAFIAAQAEAGDAESLRWAAVYEQMRRKAIQQATAAPAPRSSDPQTRSSVPAAPPRTSPAGAATLAGKWILSAARPEKFGDSGGPLYGDVSVLVQIEQTGNRISGVYNGVVFVPPNEKYNPNVNFRFTGLAAPGAPLEASIDAPLSGTVRIERVDGDRIRISYRIERTSKAVGITFKVGEAKELRRQP